MSNKFSNLLLKPFVNLRLRRLNLAMGTGVLLMPLTLTILPQKGFANTSRTATAVQIEQGDKATPAATPSSNAARKAPSRRLPNRTRRPSSNRQSRLPAPPRRLPPNRVQPGGGLSVSASACAADKPLTALVPVENPVFTAIATPSFLFYFPDGPEAIDYAEFTLLTADEKEQVYTEQFSPSAPGIASVSLPTGASGELEVGGAYHWYLNVYCKESSTVLTVDGWAQRVANSDEVEGVSAELPPVWYDAIANASEEVVAYAGSNSQVQQRWERWLTAAGLAELIDIPILGEVGE